MDDRQFEKAAMGIMLVGLMTVLICVLVFLWSFITVIQWLVSK